MFVGGGPRVYRWNDDQDVPPDCFFMLQGPHICQYSTVTIVPQAR
eukprot:jgi/Botrbrau1/4657/Bobra.33_2s0028.1